MSTLNFNSGETLPWGNSVIVTKDDADPNTLFITYRADPVDLSSNPEVQSFLQANGAEGLDNLISVTIAIQGAQFDGYRVALEKLAERGGPPAVGTGALRSASKFFSVTGNVIERHFALQAMKIHQMIFRTIPDYLRLVSCIRLARLGWYVAG